MKNNRKARKRAKLERRGTRQCRDQWRIDRALKRVMEAADSLAKSINAMTGKNLTGADFLACMDRMAHPMIVAAPMYFTDPDGKCCLDVVPLDSVSMRVGKFGEVVVDKSEEGVIHIGPEIVKTSDGKTFIRSVSLSQGG